MKDQFRTNREVKKDSTCNKENQKCLQWSNKWLFLFEWRNQFVGCVGLDREFVGELSTSNILVKLPQLPTFISKWTIYLKYWFVYLRCTVFLSGVWRTWEALEMDGRAAPVTTRMAVGSLSKHTKWQTQLYEKRVEATALYWFIKPRLILICTCW